MEKGLLTTTIEMLNQIYRASESQGRRHKSDVFVDRLRQAATEGTLLGCVNKFSNLLAVEAGLVNLRVAADFIQFCERQEAPAVLSWLREFATLAIMVASINDGNERALTARAIEVKPLMAGGVACPRGKFDVGLRVKMVAPLAHGGDIKCGNATLFRRQQVISSVGDVLTLPFYSGNALRGLLRDALADHLLSSIGLTPRRDQPPVELWFFYALYSGGALEEKNKSMTAINAILGNNGVINASGVRGLRDILPSLSLLGCALGNRILCGRVKVGDLRPLCVEWGNGGNVPAEALFDWLYLTRREDLESHDEHHGMIANTEVLRPGVELEGGIDFDGHISDLEKSALARGLELLRDKGHIGADSRRGFGKNIMEFDGLPDSSIYQKYLEENKDAIVKYLASVNAISRPVAGVEQINAAIDAVVDGGDGADNGDDLFGGV